MEISTGTGFDTTTLNFPYSINNVIGKYINTIDIVWFLENTDTCIELNSVFDYNPASSKSSGARIADPLFGY